MKVETDNEPRNKNGSLDGATNFTGTRVLVVEDEPTMCLPIKEALLSADIEAVTLVESAEASLPFLEKKFDVILIDLNARPESGLSLIQKIRGAGFNRKTPVIMISGDQRPIAMSLGFKAGASFFVYKPINKAHLMRLMRVTHGSIEYEKRRFRRISSQVKVRVKCGDRTAEGESINISLDGTLVRASCTYPRGSTVEVSLYLLAGADPVVGRGSIMRVGDDNQMGIQFEHLPIAESERLQDFLLPLITE